MAVRFRPMIEWLARVAELEPVVVSRPDARGLIRDAREERDDQLMQQRAIAARDAEILSRTGSDPELGGLAEHAARLRSDLA